MCLASPLTDVSLTSRVDYPICRQMWTSDVLSFSTPKPAYIPKNPLATLSPHHPLNTAIPAANLVPSRRAQEAMQAFEIYEDLKARMERVRTTNPPARTTSSTPHSTSEPASSIPAQPTTINNSGEATASQPNHKHLLRNPPQLQQPLRRPSGAPPQKGSPKTTLRTQPIKVSPATTSRPCKSAVSK